MELLRERVAALDVHRDQVTVCARFPDGGGRGEEMAEFATTTRGLLALSDWLGERRPELVTMEATGVYWKPVFYVLEDRFETWVCNARHVKNVPGRKTDVKDAQWLARLTECGLVQASFVPPAPIRELRDLTRYRKTRIDERAREVQRLEKVLQDAGVKLTSVASGVLSKSSRDMLEALIRGERDSQVLAEMARGPMRAKIPQLVEALEGRFGANHRFLCRELLDHIDQVDAGIGRLDDEIGRLIAPFAWAVDLLEGIPGVGRRTAQVMISEFGVDMARFETAAHLASWAAVCPGNNESAGKTRSGTTRQANKWLRRALVESALAASRTRGTSLKARYWRIAARRGKAKANIAVAHNILIIAWHLLHDRTPYLEAGDTYLQDRQSDEQRLARLRHQISALGYDTTITPRAA